MGKKYKTIVIDPPWNVPMVGHFGRRPRTRQALPYETMTLEEIRNLPVLDLAETGAHVYLWTTNKYLQESFEILKGWGVNFHQVLVGVKPSGVAPIGYVFGTEFCLLGFAGKPMLKFEKIGALNWFKMFNKSGSHSTKPNEFYELVEKMSPAGRLELFARRKRPDWDVWGNEVESDIEI